MGKSMESVYIRCPYYHREERTRQIKIVCEGVVEGTSCHQMFASGEALRQHRKSFCMGCYDRCPLAQALNRKYGYPGSSLCAMVPARQTQSQ